MKSKTKQVLIIFTLVALFVVNVAPAMALSADNAYSAIVKIKLFSLVDEGIIANASYGSGVIISRDGLVLTNHHVVTDEDSYDESERDVAYQVCLTTDKNKEPDCTFTADFIASDKDNDIALLKIKKIDGLSSESSFPYLNITETDIENNDNITVLGYPFIGGDTITLTQGIVSGKVEKYDVDWIKTDADISFGNSGGAAINDEGELVGISSRSHSDMLSSMGYLINISSVNDWIDANKTKNLRLSTLESKLINFTEKEQEIKNTNIFSGEYPAYQITKPDDWTFSYVDESGVDLENEGDSDGGVISISSTKFPFYISIDDIEKAFKLENALYLSLLDIVKIEDVLIGTYGAKKITYSVMGQVFKTYYMAHGKSIISIDYDYGKDDKDKDLVDGIINTVVLKNYISQEYFKGVYSNELHNFSINLLGGDWVPYEQPSLSKPLVLFNDSDKDSMAMFSFEKRNDDTDGLSNNELYKIILKNKEDSVSALESMGIDFNIKDAKSYVNVGNVNNGIMFEVEVKKNDEVAMSSVENHIYFDDKILHIVFIYMGDNTKYGEAKESFFSVMNKLNFNNYTKKDITEDILSYIQNDLGDDEVVESNSSDDLPDLDLEPLEEVNEKGNQEPGNKSMVEPLALKNKNMYAKLKGKIMLKVEDAGKAYYVNPNNETMHYLGRPDDAFQVMREQGVGISNSDLYKIPVGVNSGGVDTDGDGLSDYLENSLGLDATKKDTDGDGYEDKNELESGYNPWGNGKQNINNDFAGKQSGRILLQVEKNGEAWYVNPSDSKRYFLGRPTDAFSAMRNLGLGISNNDFDSL